MENINLKYNRINSFMGIIKIIERDIRKLENQKKNFIKDIDRRINKKKDKLQKRKESLAEKLNI